MLVFFTCRMSPHIFTWAVTRSSTAMLFRHSFAAYGRKIYQKQVNCTAVLSADTHSESTYDLQIDSFVTHYVAVLIILLKSEEKVWFCSETALTGETQLHCEFVHPQDADRWPPRQEANGWTTGSVRLCGVKMQGFHRAPPQQLDWGSDRSLCCEEEEVLVELGEGNMWLQLAFHIASHCQRGA